MASYHLDQDRFYALLDEIVAQGGQHLPGACNPTQIDYKRVSPTDKIGTHGCRKEMRVSLPYEAIQQKLGPPTKGEFDVVVCAEGDGLEWWPRFQGDD